MSLKAGTLLQGGKYQIVSQLGHGGFGVTYLANHNLLNKKVCIKEFFPKDFMSRGEDMMTMCVNSASNIALMNTLKRRFIKEARTISHFDHPNIITIYDVFEENATAYYVMEYIDGYSLYDLLTHHGALNVEQAKKCINKVLDAVEYIHDHHTLHLDIKPANIMIRRSDGRVTLIDFGLSKEVDDNGNMLTSSTMVGLTPRYAPLEQLQQSKETPITTATDMYAIGATLLTMVTGNMPPLISDVIAGKHIEIVDGQPNDIKDAVVRSMAVIPSKRIATVAQFRELLNVADGGAGTGSAGGNVGGGTGTVQEKTENPKIKMWVWIAAMLAVIAVSGGAYWYANSYNSDIEEQMAIINEQCPLYANTVCVDEVKIKRNARSVVTICYTGIEVYEEELSRHDLIEYEQGMSEYDNSVDGIEFLYQLSEECDCDFLEVVFNEGWSIECEYYDEDGVYLFTTEVGYQAYEEWNEERGDRYEEEVYYDGPNMVI